MNRQREISKCCHNERLNEKLTQKGQVSFRHNSKPYRASEKEINTHQCLINIKLPGIKHVSLSMSHPSNEFSKINIIYFCSKCARKETNWKLTWDTTRMTHHITTVGIILSPPIILTIGQTNWTVLSNFYFTCPHLDKLHQCIHTFGVKLINMISIFHSYLWC